MYFKNRNSKTMQVLVAKSIYTNYKYLVIDTSIQKNN